MVRETLWGDLGEVSSALPAANSAVLTNVTGAALLALRPWTVVRIRGLWHAVSDQEVANETYSLAFGAAVVSDQAVAIGITAVPTPSIDADSDLWMLYERIMGSFLIKSTGEGIVEPGGVTKEFDSRAMRKVEDGSQLIFVVENGAVTAAGCIVRTFARVLIKLH